MENNSNDFSIIDKGLHFDGEIKTDGRLIIKGTLKGSLEGHEVVIAEDGIVIGDTKVGSITIGGKFEGDLRAINQLTILSTGTCMGKVICKDLVVEAGGLLNAEVTCLSMKQINKLKKSFKKEPKKELSKEPNKVIEI